MNYTKVDFLTKEIVRNLDKKKVIANFAENKSLEGQLKQQGDTVLVQVLPDVTWNRGGTAGADITDNSFSITQESLKIDKVATVRYEMTELDTIQYNRGLMSDVSSRVAEGQARLIDQYVAGFVRKAETTNKFNEVTPVTLATNTIQSEIEKLRVALDEKNVNVYQKQVGLFISPNISSLLRQAGFLASTDKGVDIAINGYMGKMSGFELYETNMLPTAVSLTLDTQPTAGNTVTINGIVFTYVGAGTAANPGEIALTGSLAGDQANLVNAINGTGTKSAATYIDVSTANRKILSNLDLFSIDFATNVATLYANSTLTCTETFTAGTNVFGAVSKIMFAMEKGAVHTAYQFNKMKVTEAELGFRSNLLGEMVYGGNVFSINGRRIATSRVANA